MPHPGDRARRPAGDRSRRPRRTQLRRRRAALLAALVSAAAGGLAIAWIAGGSSHAHTHAPGGGNSTLAAGRLGGRRSGAVRRAAAAPNRAGESTEIRRLIARGKPIYCAGPRGDEVALTFDDGPGPYTRLMLAKLHKHGVRATFFVVGRNISLVPGATRAERAIGAVGDHTFTHPLLTSLARGEAERQIVQTQLALEHSTGGPVFLFRPPYGAHDASVDRVVREHGLLEILWTVDSADSLGANYAQIERNVIGGLRPGAIILMHENHGQTVRAMLAIFAALQRRHLRAVSVPQLLSDDPPTAAQLAQAGGGCAGRTSSTLGGS